MKIELNNMKWDGGHGKAGLSVVEAYIGMFRTEAPVRTRSRISKEHNYVFTGRRAVQVIGGVWKIKQLKN